MNIKITKGDAVKFINNCEMINGKIVIPAGNGKFTPVWNGDKLNAAGKTSTVKALGTCITKEQVGQFSDFLFEMGENGAYKVEMQEAPKRYNTPKDQNSIFGASSDFGH